MTPAVLPVELHHSGLVVSDLGRSVTFYQDLFGAEIELSVDRVSDDAVMRDIPDANYSLAILSLPGGRLELIEYHSPSDGAQSPPRACDIGAAHIAIVVENTRDAVKAAAGAGMEMLGETVDVPGGLTIGFGKDPDGNHIEFIEYNGRS